MTGNPANQKKQAIIAVVALVAIMAIAFIAYGALSSRAVSSDDSSNSLGGLAYELSSDSGAGGPALQQIASCEVRTAANTPMELDQILTGKLTVINLWASWCSYCVDELEDYQRLYDEYGDKVQFVLVDVAQGDMREFFSARDIVRENGYTAPVYFDVSGSLADLFNIRALPLSVILDESGNVIMNRLGEIQYENMKATLDAALAS